jgi:hypothetical protein
MTDPFAPPGSTPPEQPPGDPYAPPTGAPLYGAPVYGAPVYGAPVYGAPVGSAALARNGFGTTALVLGILAVLTSLTVVFGVLLGVLAVIFGFLGRRRARRQEATNGGMALAGMLTGAAGIVIGVLIVVAFLDSDRGRAYLDCVGNAVTNQQAQVCQDQLTHSFR